MISVLIMFHLKSVIIIKKKQVLVMATQIFGGGFWLDNEINFKISLWVLVTSEHYLSGFTYTIWD